MRQVLIIGALLALLSGLVPAQVFLPHRHAASVPVPPVEFRAMWVNPLTNSVRAAGLVEITNTAQAILDAKCNVWLMNLQSSAIFAITNGTAWDFVTDICAIAKSKGIFVYAWFAPYNIKSHELGIHPEWRSYAKNGTPDSSGICLLRPEVRQYELDLLTPFIARYPLLSGIQLEEPGYETILHCACDYCTNYYQTNFGLDITQTTGPVILTQRIVYAAAGNDFVARLWTNMQAIHPGFKLIDNAASYDLSSARQVGHDWANWWNQRWTAAFLPQLYSTNWTDFSNNIVGVRAFNATVPIIPGIGIVFGGGPTTNTVEAVTNEIYMARGKACPGVSFFRKEYIDGTMQTAIAGTSLSP